MRKAPLKNYFQQLTGYQTERSIDLSNDNVKMLKLDDYIFIDYKGPTGHTNLYIGYYYTANKAYSAHSPLICYPSQGWKIADKPQKKTLQLGPNIINYEEIITSLGEQKELVLYWYQAGLQTNTQVYKNKIDMGFNKLRNNDEQHGFVRVAIPLTTSYTETQKAATNFIMAFYPEFISYIRNKAFTPRKN